MGSIDGATLFARCLKQHGVRFIFGIVVFPVQPIARAAQMEGITYVGMRNEQAASYAAQAASYLTGRTQAALVVSGPGVIHALAGLANAKSNCWPMILIGGASSIKQNGMGAFQEEAQVTAALPFSKYARGVERVDKIPYYVEQAVRSSIFARPGLSRHARRHHPRRDRRGRGVDEAAHPRAAAHPGHTRGRTGRPRFDQDCRAAISNRRQGHGLVARRG